MDLLSAEIIDTARRSVLCWLATVSPDGQPNVSPKEIWAPFDASHLVVATIASPTTVRNVRQSPQVCISFVDILVQKGFKVTGTARNITRDDPAFERWAAPLLVLAEPRFKVHSVIVIRARRVEPILAPSYRLCPSQTSEASQIASARRAHGLSP